MNAARFTLMWLSYWFDWQPALTIVQPETFKRWRRQDWRWLGQIQPSRGDRLDAWLVQRWRDSPSQLDVNPHIFYRRRRPARSNNSRMDN